MPGLCNNVEVGIEFSPPPVFRNTRHAACERAVCDLDAGA
jgi:hypothetical protein